MQHYTSDQFFAKGISPGWKETTATLTKPPAHGRIVPVEGGRYLDPEAEIVIDNFRYVPDPEFLGGDALDFEVVAGGQRFIVQYTIEVVSDAPDHACGEPHEEFDDASASVPDTRKVIIGTSSRVVIDAPTPMTVFQAGSKTYQEANAIDVEGPILSAYYTKFGVYSDSGVDWLTERFKVSVLTQPTYASVHALGTVDYATQFASNEDAIRFAVLPDDLPEGVSELPQDRFQLLVETASGPRFIVNVPLSYDAGQPPIVIDAPTPVTVLPGGDRAYHGSNSKDIGFLIRGAYGTKFGLNSRIDLPESVRSW
jgi:hypothetical protein